MRQGLEDCFFGTGQISTFPRIASGDQAVEPGGWRFRAGGSALQIQHVGVGVAIAFTSETIQQAGSFHELGVICKEFRQVFARHFSVAKFCQYQSVNKADQKIAWVTRQPDQRSLAGKLKFAVG